MNLPNKITLTRIFMIPVFVAVFYCGFLTRWCFLASAVIFALAAGTDALDGHIARSRGLVTDLGKFLDPIADKVLVSTALIVMLTYMPFMQAWSFSYSFVWLCGFGVCVALILARELIVSGFRMIAAGKHLVLAADKLGKVKTVFQDLAIVVLLTSMAFNGTAFMVLSYVGDGLLVICTVLTVISGIHYILKNKQVLHDKSGEEKKEEVKAEVQNVEEKKGEIIAEAEEEEVNPVYIRALAIVIQLNSASISLIQRKCQVGYVYAGKIIEWMERKKYISSFDGSTSGRRVLLSKEEFEKIYGNLDQD